MISLLAALTITLPPPTDLRVSAPPDDDGTHLEIVFRPSPDASVTSYEIVRARAAEKDKEILPPPPPGEGWEAVKTVENAAEPTLSYVDEVPDPSQHWVYAVRALSGKTDKASGWTEAGPARPSAAFFNSKRWFLFGVVAAMLVLLAWYTQQGKRGKAIFIRRIPGIDAMEEAIGRSTEMGRPVLYIPGIEEIQDIQTIAGLLILGHVAEVAARYETEIRVACAIPLAMVIGEEIVRQGYYNAGRPEAHRPQNIQFISSEQFAFTAGCIGIMNREKPATHIFMGRFYGESLVLAETGFVNKAIQIAGTAELTQLPFFIAACDYAIIGEELFAVSAYLSKDTRQLATLKATDALKLAVIALIVLGVFLNTAGVIDLSSWVAP